MRILLVNPPSGELTIGLKHLAKVEPLGLEIIGAAVADHQVELLDMEIETDLAGALQRFRPDIVGASAQIVQTYTARRVMKTVKQFDPNIVTVLGGHHATLCPEEFNTETINAIVLGEGVPAFRELVERRRQGRSFDDVAGLALPRDGRLIFTAPRPLPPSLDHQPLPNRSLTAKYRARYFYLFESPVASIQTSLGCVFPCNFCSCQKFTNRRFIARSPELVVADLSSIEQEFVMFCDDHSFIDVKRMARLHDLIVERGIKKRYFAYTRTDCVVQNPELFEKWARIGLQLVMTGLEAIDDTHISALNKRSSLDINERAIEILGKCGIALSAGFVIMPDYTEADFQRIDAYVRRRPNIALTEMTPLTPLPATDLYTTEKANLVTHNREVYDLAHFVTPTQLPSNEIDRLLRNYYLRVLWRAIVRMKLYHPRYAFKRHMPRLLLGTLRNARLLAHSHEHLGVPAPLED